MVTLVDVAMPIAAWVALSLFLASIFRYELDMNGLLAAMTGLSSMALGVLLAVALQATLAVPFLWIVIGFALVLGLLAGLYELVT